MRCYTTTAESELDGQSYEQQSTFSFVDHVDYILKICSQRIPVKTVT